MLGQGGFGRVIEVTRADTGDRFAMKAILKQGSASASTNAKVGLHSNRLLANPNPNPNPNPNAHH